MTGLPLVFHEEIGHLLGTAVEAPAMPANTPRASLDRVVAVAQARHPGKVVQYLSREIDDDAYWYVLLGDTPVDQKGQVTVAVDARTERTRAGTRPAADRHGRARRRRTSADDQCA